MLGGNRFESGIIILYSASEQGYLVLALYKHALLLYIIMLSVEIQVIRIILSMEPCAVDSCDWVISAR